MKYLWRISRHCDLAGLGGERSDGRWHTAARGKRIVYLSEHPAVALVEVLANLAGDPKLFPDTYQLMKVEVPEDIKSEEIVEADLGGEWRDYVAATRGVGDAWLQTRNSLLLNVPSAPSPESRNYLLNASHIDAGRLMIAWCKVMRYDRRLFHLARGLPDNSAAANADSLRE